VFQPFLADPESGALIRLNAAPGRLADPATVPILTISDRTCTRNNDNFLEAAPHPFSLSLGEGRGEAFLNAASQAASTSHHLHALGQGFKPCAMRRRSLGVQTPLDPTAKISG